MKNLFTLLVIVTLFPVMSFSQNIDSLLNVVREKDQQVRIEQTKIINTSPIDQDALIGSVLKMEEVDAECQKIVFELIDNGIPQGLSEESYETIWLVVQHADVKAQKKYLPEFWKLSETGLLSASDCATMEDRVLMNRGKAQKYGTQCRMINETIYLWPVKNPDKVESLRKTVGLPSLETMHEIYKQQGMDFIWDKTMEVKDFKGKDMIEGK